ncbi:MAG: hypothetical protein K2Y29_16410 [Beijerinckiaceae bacterium]|nr:hypothetical protein [Beijerinckiaceae bacterium]
MAREIQATIGGGQYTLQAEISESGGQKFAEFAMSALDSAGVQNGLLIGSTFSLDGAQWRIVDGLTPASADDSLVYIFEPLV